MWPKPLEFNFVSFRFDLIFCVAYSIFHLSIQSIQCKTNGSSVCESTRSSVSFVFQIHESLSQSIGNTYTCISSSRSLHWCARKERGTSFVHFFLKSRRHFPRHLYTAGEDHMPRYPIKWLACPHSTELLSCLS